MFLASALGLKDECFYSDSEAISHNLGLQPPTVPLNALLPRIHTHSHPHLPSYTHTHTLTQAHTPHLDTRMHSELSHTHPHSNIAIYSYTYILIHIHSRIFTHMHHICAQAHNSLTSSRTHLCTHTQGISPPLTEQIYRLPRLGT